MVVEVAFAPVLDKAKSPPALIAGGLLNLVCFDLASSSDRSSPPAWSSHDDGGDDDGGASASQGQR